MKICESDDRVARRVMDGSKSSFHLIGACWDHSYNIISNLIWHLRMKRTSKDPLEPFGSIVVQLVFGRAWSSFWPNHLRSSRHCPWVILWMMIRIEIPLQGCLDFFIKISFSQPCSELIDIDWPIVVCIKSPEEGYYFLRFFKTTFSSYCKGGILHLLVNRYRRHERPLQARLESTVLLFHGEPTKKA